MRKFKSLVPYDEALEKVLGYVPPSGTKTLLLEDAMDVVLAGDVYAPVDSPPFDRSAMDGYAVVAEDTYLVAEDSPVTLTLIDSINAGEVSRHKASSGTAIKVMTGAKMPDGASAVVMQEFAARHENLVDIYKKVAPNTHVSNRGEDYCKGDLVLKEGATITPQAMALLKSLGFRSVEAKVLRVGIIVTGDELLQEHREGDLGKIIDSNSIMLKGLLQKARCTISYHALVPDKSDEMSRAVSDASIVSDFVLITGGSSFGEKDLVSGMLCNHIFHGVGIKPGKPIGFAMMGVPVFSLSGYPVAAFTQFYLFVIPFIEKAFGSKLLTTVTLPFGDAIASSLGRREFVRCIVRENSVLPVRISGSTMLSSVTKADGFVLTDSFSEGINKGDDVAFTYFFR